MANGQEAPYRPALLIVDFQEDFCPPHGSLAVNGGRDIAKDINKLMELPWTIRVATQDWHPADHISFASNHPAPYNKPFESVRNVKNPLNEHESEDIRLWPDHCIQETNGAQLIPEFDASKVDYIIKKGYDNRVEMYSAFKDTFKEPCVHESGLSRLLKEKGITHVFVVGIAEDYCVKWTALHAASEGYETYVIPEATKAVDQGEDALRHLREAMQLQGVNYCSADGSEIKRVAQQ